MEATVRRCISAWLFITALSFSTGPLSQTNACEAFGDTLSSARQAYTLQCSLPRVDCDQIDLQWLCSSDTITVANDPALVNIIPGTSGTQFNSGTASPVLSVADFPNIGLQSGRPICLTDSNSQNGYGFENGRSCVVAAGITATKQTPLLGQRICAPWMEISYGNHLSLQNNTWNNSGVFTDNWSQCIRLDAINGNYVASWDYNWLDRTEGEEYAVKSYPQVYYGRKTSFNQSGSVSETGLPAGINAIPQINVDFKYSETGNAERNVALESFLHTSCAAEDENKFFEMMVWVASPSIRTPGSLVTTARIDGRNWSVYTNPALSWGYVAFVAETQINEGSLDWNAFIDWSRNQGPVYGVPPTGDNTCLGAIEIGSETFWGNGTFSLERFDIQVQ